MKNEEKMREEKMNKRNRTTFLSFSLKYWAEAMAQIDIQQLSFEISIAMQNEPSTMIGLLEHWVWIVADITV